MAVFMINICKFDRCGIIFKNLADLIQHIEENHIDNESTLQYNTTKEIENATCLPLSYVLRFYTNKVKVEEDADELVHTNGLVPPPGSIMSPASETNVFINKIQSPPPPPLVATQQLSSPSIVPALGSSPQGSEPSEDLEEDSMLEDSNDSWTLAEEYSSEYILKHGSKMTTPMDGNVEKPFACPVPGCKKRYKNVNGIKYHSKNGHKTDGRIYKNFKCHCGKSYKTSQGLRTHSLMQHGASPLSTTHQHHLADNNTTMTRIQDGDLQTDVLQVPSSRIKALTLKHIEALGVPVKTFVLNRTPPPATTTPSNINILAAATCVKSSDNNNNSNVLEINTSLQSPASNSLSPNGNSNGMHVNGIVSVNNNNGNGIHVNSNATVTANSNGFGSIFVNTNNGNTTANGSSSIFVNTNSGSATANGTSGIYVNTNGTSSSQSPGGLLSPSGSLTPMDGVNDHGLPPTPSTPTSNSFNMGTPTNNNISFVNTGSTQNSNSIGFVNMGSNANSVGFVNNSPTNNSIGFIHSSTSNNNSLSFVNTNSTPTSNSIGFVHTTSTPIAIPNALGGGALSNLLTPATSPSCSPVSSLSSYHSL